MTAAAAEARTTTEERIVFVGKNVAGLLRESGLTWGMLAEDWGVSPGTARNTAYWPSPRSVPPADRIEALERAAGLPVGTLLDQYYVDRPDPAYWGDKAGAKTAAKAVPASKAAARKPAARTATATVAKVPDAAPGPALVLDEISDHDAASALRSRIAHLERLFVAFAPALAPLVGLTRDELIAEMRLGS